MELKKGQTIMVDVDLQMPAAILHEVVSNRSGMPPEGFALYYQSKQLEGEAALSSWGVAKDANIEVKTRGRGGAPKTRPRSNAMIPGAATRPGSAPSAPSKGPAPVVSAPSKDAKDAKDAKPVAAAAAAAKAATTAPAAATPAAAKAATAAPAAATPVAANPAGEAALKEAREAREAKRAKEAKEQEDKFVGEMQARRNETATKMQELQTCAASKHPIPLAPPPAIIPRATTVSSPGSWHRWADNKVTLPPTFNKAMLDAKMKSVGLGRQVDAPLATAHELLSRCSGGKGLSGVVPTSRTPQPAH